MVKVSMEVRSGVARFCVAVRAQSIRRAVSLVGARYPGSEVGVKFPIAPESFFADDPIARAEMIVLEDQPAGMAA